MAATPLQVVTAALTTFNQTLPLTKRWSTSQIAAAAQATVTALGVVGVGYRSNSRDVFYVGLLGVPSVPTVDEPLRAVSRLVGCE